MADISSPLPFIGITPCRQYDSRSATPLPQNTAREVVITGAPCGIPTSARAVSLNVTVFDILGQTGNAVFQVGTTSNPTTAWINYPIGQGQIGNAGVLPLSGAGSIFFRVQQGGGSIDFTIDVNGYYASAAANQNNTFEVDTLAPWAITGKTGSSNTLATGVLGQAWAPTGNTIGVWGETFSPTDGARGVMGFAQSTTGQTYGVQGLTNTTGSLGAGVYGEATNALANGGYFRNTAAGISTYLATQIGGVSYGVFAQGRIAGTSLDISGSPKNFVSPHPLDPSKEIKYASVEARTVDVYFRGTGTLSNGYARIEVPDDFRYTAREGTYMTTLTPVGRPVSMSVESEGPEGIVVRGSGNVSFHYVVYAERAEIEGFEPVQPNVTFVPEFMEKVHLLKALPRTTKALLIRNGTLNEDGTYNEATARAMGWVIPEPRATELPRR